MDEDKEEDKEDTETEEEPKKKMKNSPRKIRERRIKIQLLQSRGMNQIKIAEELGVNPVTITRDMAYINEMSRHGLYGMAKTSATLIYNCIQGLDECLDVCWRIHDNPDNNPEINQWHKIAAIRLAILINEKKANIFMNGPAILEVDTLTRKVKELRDDVIADRFSMR
jgi:hypothetical protein